MARFDRCLVKVDENKTKRLIMFKYGSMTAYCIQNGIARSRLYQVLSLPHYDKKSKCLQDLAKNLGVDVEELLK